MASGAKQNQRVRGGALLDCNDTRLFARTLDVGELFLDVPTSEQKESLTKFNEHSHAEHTLFVEHHLLSDFEGRYWREVSRWIKYEEAIEAHGNHWAKPRIPALNFHSMVNLRRIMETGLILLDLNATDMEEITTAVVIGLAGHNLSERSDQDRGDFETVRKTLLLRHRHVDDSEKVWNYLEKELNQSGVSLVEIGGGNASFTLEDVKGIRKLSHLVRRIPEDAEGALVLSGQLDTLKGLAVAFVRLSEGIIIPGVTEIPIPVRFVFLLLGPGSCQINYIEVGRCMGVLLSTSIFRHIVYEARERRDILVALNEFLDASIVIPHGEWDYEMFHIQELRARENAIYGRKFRRSFDLSLTGSEGTEVMEVSPFKRTGIPFGGVWNDIRRRYPKYWSDIRDGFDTQCAGVMVFMYFACVAAACTLGTVLSEKTERYIGIAENLFGSAIGGVIFALFSCQPILIMATTGPTLVFEDNLYDFSKKMELGSQFLAFRFWTAVWMTVVGLIVIGAEASVLVRHFTRFTQEIFAVFISVVFIWESFRGVSFKLSTLVPKKGKTVQDSGNFYIYLGLMMATFVLAMTFRAFKDSSFGTKLLRKLFGNFGVMLTIVTMSAFAYISTPFRPIENLLVPDALSEGLQPTRHDNVSSQARAVGWIVDPTKLSVPWIFAASIPGLLLFVLVFLEMSIGELLMDRKESLMRKGTGFHADALLICFINILMGLLGTNYLSAATLRGVTHLVALAVYSTNNPPGEAPHIISTKEQRVTSLFASILLGCSVVMGKVLQFVPVTVLYGFFFFMGVTSLKGMQFADRIYLFFKQVAKHPDVPYVTQVRTWKMHVYTLIQILSLACIWAIKSSKAALILPLTFLLLPIIRKFLLVRFFQPEELEALDGEGPPANVTREPLKVDLTKISNRKPKSSNVPNSTSSGTMDQSESESES